MIICDKCGCTIQEPVNKNTFYLSDHKPARNSYEEDVVNTVTVHLCFKCQKKVLDFINDDKVLDFKNEERDNV